MEQTRWNEEIDGKYARVDDAGNIIPDIAVFTAENLDAIKTVFNNHTLYTLLESEFKNIYEKLKNIFKCYSHEILHSNIDYNIGMEMTATRTMSVNDLVNNGYLILPHNPDSSNYGMYLMLK